MKKAVPLKPKFESLEEPNTIIKHINELTEKQEIKHASILSKLLKQFKKIDFEKIANPSVHDNFKLSNKHYTIISIDNVLRIAKHNNWDLCKNHSFIYLYNGAYWDEIDKEAFQKF